MKDVTLCFDFGNTRLKCGVFNNGLFIEVIILSNDNSNTIQDIINKYHPSKTILASVVNYDNGVDKLLSSHSIFHKISYSTKLPFSTPVNKPQTIGADRIVLAAAAVYFYAGKNNLIIGMGSCITYNFINKYNQFMGGSISPGMKMRFTSLHTFTAKLPLVQPDWSFRWLVTIQKLIF